MKRVYGKAEAKTVPGGFAVALDGRPARTPAGARLLLPSRALAEAVAGEWERQDDRVRPDTMPLTRLANAFIDVVAREREKVVESTLGFAATDLLCYRAAPETELGRRQNETWQPLLDWAALRYDAPLAVHLGVIPGAQPAPSIRALGRAVAAFDDLSLTGLHAATAALGSLVLGLAVADGRVGADEACAIAGLDEAYQVERWGDDGEAAGRRETLSADVRAAAAFIRLSLR